MRARDGVKIAGEPKVDNLNGLEGEEDAIDVAVVEEITRAQWFLVRAMARLGIVGMTLSEERYQQVVAWVMEKYKDNPRMLVMLDLYTRENNVLNSLVIRKTGKVDKYGKEVVEWY